MNKKDLFAIKKHFSRRLLERYGIETKSRFSLEGLQKQFIKRLSFMFKDRYKTRLIRQYPDRHKSLYITNFMGKRVKFIYSSKYNIAKTCIV